MFEVMIARRNNNSTWMQPRYGLAASSINDSKAIYKRNQLLMMADAYHNSGTIRTMVNKRVDFMLGNRTKYTVEPNEVQVLETEEEQQAMEAIMTSQEVRTLKADVNRVNKVCNLHDKLINLCINNFVFGRSLGGIEREKTKNFPKFGEPIALKVLNTLRIKKVNIDEKTGNFKGYNYDFGIVNRTNEPIAAIDMLPMWYNDSNIYDNTPYQGMSAIWSILGIAQSNGFINDEDIPEACKTIWTPYGFVYVGDKNEESTAKLRKKAEVGTLIYHNQKDLRFDIADTRPDITKLHETATANMKRMCIDFGFPMFLLFEDTANFATAQEVIQAYKAGVMERDRTWLRGVLEQYWYDPMLADHIPEIQDLKDMWRAKIKIKAAFEDITFETRKDVIEADEKLINLGIYNALDVARDVDARPEIIERLEMQEKAIEQARQAAIMQKVEELKLQKQEVQIKGQQAAQRPGSVVKKKGKSNFQK
jgi:hypothetical protein